MSKKTLEYISNKIVTSQSLIEKVNQQNEGESNNLTIDKIQLKPTFQDLALTKYFDGYFDIFKKNRFKRVSMYKALTPKSLSFIYEGNDNYNFLTKPEDKLILVRSSINREKELSQKNIIDSINSILQEDSIKMTQTEIIKEFTETDFLTESDFESYLDGIIPKAEYNTVGSKNIINDITIQRTYKFLSKLVNIISKKLDKNVLFILPSLVKKDKALILSDFLEERYTIGIIAFIPNIHSLMTYKTTKIPDNMIFFDNIFQLDYENNTINSYIGSKITKNIIIQNGIALHNKQFKSPIKNEKILFEPLDRYQELSVIQVNNPGNIKTNYLLGITGNLYEDDDKFNDLVGRIQYLDSNSGKGDIYWCQKYYNKFKK